ncbi:hypothetical protein L0P88_06855 [Muricauda sp. SCSIO 64092]|uniref:hypothetical protein n=1 Tax=Allomuricauda sp. SCSIO 64092 TaxID=2908842 RepID=UPI001FF50E89|nr:hypothetical protein [Muricauda sp. SCSIO 64092]UOY08265.1 hypothetical protein L0P88_06855 [Muricauda sp. SCSIO 64092]
MIVKVAEKPFANKHLATKSRNNTFFLSQFPLVEHRYKINITYDSIPTYEMDSTTRDTLNIYGEINEIDRDTTDFK